eukprot:260378-Amphidinium_carterae.1
MAKAVHFNTESNAIAVFEWRKHFAHTRRGVGKRAHVDGLVRARQAAPGCCQSTSCMSVSVRDAVVN